MKRLYYLTASIDSVQHISRDLDRAGIDTGRLHVLGRDPGPLEAAKVHGTTICCLLYTSPSPRDS